MRALWLVRKMTIAVEDAPQILVPVLESLLVTLPSMHKRISKFWVRQQTAKKTVENVELDGRTISCRHEFLVKLDVCLRHPFGAPTP